MPPKNMIVAQSGGPSPVINNTLRGIVETARQMSEIGTVYGGWHGIEGVLKEELIDLSAQCADEIALLRTTPAAGSIGTCRYKLKDKQTDDFDRIIEVFKAHNIGYFCYIGGNDSMHTANTVANLARARGLPLRLFLGCLTPNSLLTQKPQDVGTPTKEATTSLLVLEVR